MELSSTRGTVVVSDALKDFFEETSVPAAVRKGNLVWVTGQTGLLDDGSMPANPADQIRQAFVLVEGCLQAAGASWSTVVEMTTYTVGLREHGETMLSVASEFLQSPYPAWTAVGVAELWEEGAMFELQCVAAVSAPA